MNESTKRRTFLKAALAGTALGAVPLTARAAVITIGYVDLSFYEVTANALKWVLEKQGWNVAMRSGSHSKIYPMLASGEIDLFVASWLPYAHADYWQEYKDSLVEVSMLFDNAQLFWSVPDYVPADAVSSVADLAKPEVAGKMFRTIRGTLPDSGLMIGSRKIFEHYRLADAGYELVPGPAKAWLANFDERIGKKDWFVMPLWRPQYLNKAYRLRVLAEPQDFLGKANRGMLVANRDFFGKLGRKQRQMLSRMEMSLKAVTEMDYWVNMESMDPRDASRRWLATNPNTVEYWLEGPDDE